MCVSSPDDCVVQLGSALQELFQSMMSMVVAWFDDGTDSNPEHH
jgi:hypothetical protein